MALKFLNKKGWHTGSLRNIENVWKAEQKHGAEQKKLEELRKQILEERERAEFRLLQERAGLAPRQERLEFLYESGLGVGKGSAESFKALQVPPKAETSSVASAEPSTSKAAVPGALFEVDKPQSANDTWRKLHSDPLLLIRQREQDALARIKNNPVQMAMIRKSVETEKKQKEKKKKKKKKNKEEQEQKKHRPRYSSESSKSDDSDEKSRSKYRESTRNKEEKFDEKSKSENYRSTRNKEERSDEKSRVKHDRSSQNKEERSNEKSRVKHDRSSQNKEEKLGEKSRFQYHSSTQRMEEMSDKKSRSKDHQSTQSKEERFNEKSRSTDHRSTQRGEERSHEKSRSRSHQSTQSKEERSYDKSRSKHRESTQSKEERSDEKLKTVAVPPQRDGGMAEDWRRRKAAPRMSEEERAARLREMQMNAELHEEQRWKRIKKASEKDAQEAKQDSGKNFLDDARKSMFGTEKGGSSTIEESVRRRTYYLQGGGTADEVNAFRRH